MLRSSSRISRVTSFGSITVPDMPLFRAIVSPSLIQNLRREAERGTPLLNRKSGRGYRQHLGSFLAFRSAAASDLQLTDAQAVNLQVVDLDGGKTGSADHKFADHQPTDGERADGQRAHRQGSQRGGARRRAAGRIG